jgi:hypothetical protein
MITITKSKKIVAILMSVLLVAAVSAISVSALSGTYTTILEADVKVPPHTLYFLGNATVSGNTITIPVDAPATVVVTVGGNTYSTQGYITEITSGDSYTVSTSGYHDDDLDIDIVTGLTITGTDISTISTTDFSSKLLFDVANLNGATIHTDMGATLTLQ